MQDVRHHGAIRAVCPRDHLRVLLAIGETVILLHPLLPLAGAPIPV